MDNEEMSDSQKQMQRAAQNSCVATYKAFAEIQAGPNPLTKQEIAKLIERHPSRYECLKGYLK